MDGMGCDATQFSEGDRAPAPCRATTEVLSGSTEIWLPQLRRRRDRRREFSVPLFFFFFFFLRRLCSSFGWSEFHPVQ